MGIHLRWSSLAFALCVLLLSPAVAQAGPTISTQASPDVTLGSGSLTDNATVLGRVSPFAGATIDFRLYGPGDDTCANAPVFQSLAVSQPTAEGPVASAAFTPTAAGTYRWIASYSGDVNNAPVAGACNDASETTVVARKATNTGFAVSGSQTFKLGTAFRTLSVAGSVNGRVNPVVGATMTFRLYGPGDATCGGAPASVSTVTVPTSTNSVSSQRFTPSQAGTYRWGIAYGGDANNAPSALPCFGGVWSVTRATPTVATAASPDIALGSGSLTDSATVTGRVSPLAGATIDFRLYGPGDDTCANAPVFESLAVSQPTEEGAVASAAFTPTAAGTYRWIASYSGEANNAPVAGACNDASETTVVARKAGTAVSVIFSMQTFALGAAGRTLSMTTSLSGRVNPVAGATMAFRLYAPGDTTCSGGPVFASTVAAPTNTDTIRSQQFTPSQAGTYAWTAEYSGDAANAPSATPCVGGLWRVTRATPTLATASSPDIALGAGDLTGNATVAGRVSAVAGATLDFRLYGPDDPTCAGAPVFESLDVSQPIADGPVTSAAFTPTLAGTYRWTSSYNGEANNEPEAGACGAARATTVARNVPTISASANGGSTLGDLRALTASAAVRRRLRPSGGDTVAYRLYGPDDATCAGTPVLESVRAIPENGVPLGSRTFRPAEAGSYRWVATYSGDAHNASVASACNDILVRVVRASPTIATAPSPDIALGSGSLTSGARVSGRVSPVAGAKIDFRLYGPGDDTCSGAPVFESLDVSQPTADGTVASVAFTPTAGGTYRWKASYSGDANNRPDVSACNAPDATARVGDATPPPPAPPPTTTPAAAPSSPQAATAPLPPPPPPHRRPRYSDPGSQRPIRRRARAPRRPQSPWPARSRATPRPLSGTATRRTTRLASRPRRSASSSVRSR